MAEKVTLFKPHADDDSGVRNGACVASCLTGVEAFELLCPRLTHCAIGVWRGFVKRRLRVFDVHHAQRRRCLVVLCDLNAHAGWRDQLVWSVHGFPLRRRGICVVKDELEGRGMREAARSCEASFRLSGTRELRHVLER